MVGHSRMRILSVSCPPHLSKHNSGMYHLLRHVSPTIGKWIFHDIFLAASKVHQNETDSFHAKFENIGIFINIFSNLHNNAYMHIQ